MWLLMQVQKSTILIFRVKWTKLASNTQMYQLLDVSNDSIRFGAYTSDGSYFDGFTIRKDMAGNRSITEHAPQNNSDYLKPTKRFLQKSSKKELEKYNKEMEEWEKTRK